MKTVLILCEGGTACNAGFSAAQREEARIPSGLSDLARGYAMDRARSLVSRELRYTPHVRCGVGRGGTVLFACQACGHERAYGNTTWANGL